MYLKLFLPPLRGGTTGARKRYAGLVRRAGEPVVDFTGMEIVRRDWTDLAHQVQRELYTRLFHDEPVDRWLAAMVRDVRAGLHDDLLVYRKGLRKDLEDYTASTPPHVSAARKMEGDPGRIIEYVMTKLGPEPVHERKSPLDHEHYVQKQIRPVAEPVLAWLGLEFDRVVGDDLQMNLF
jgi:DNA polymerase II